ncbi:hypothetical protein CKM354_001010800 [Cercospora kikuchii]|uniref:Uncharacterized protein n=1 Tax=Cercospora kikuchii TaxID=84275 RepID=A0A9P3CQS0_9PEZI|nr:uncharacterized protein CKM354_001010800 [Cercospora kikuchii]GIZ47006.1 hypothetical protein CKM354_001010800 [Cercospora kikuchii]
MESTLAPIATPAGGRSTAPKQTSSHNIAGQSWIPGQRPPKHNHTCKGEGGEVCEKAHIKARIKFHALAQRGTVLPSNDGQFDQRRKFTLTQVHNRSILLYVVREDVMALHNTVMLRAAYSTIAEVWHEAHPTLMLEDRWFFHPCQYRASRYPHHDPENHLDDLVEDHISLCNWFESDECRVWQENSWCRFGFQPRQDDILMPTVRAILMLYWPHIIQEEDGHGLAALVLTGDDAHLLSGPISFASIANQQIPGYIGSEQIAYTSLSTAVKFLSDLDRREVDADPTLRARTALRAEKCRRENIDLPEQHALPGPEPEVEPESPQINLPEAQADLVEPLPDQETAALGARARL